jgi:excinuclease ABC subunit A
VVVEHDMAVVAGADWVIDLGPSGGDKGGAVMAAGTPHVVATSAESRTAPYLAAALGQETASQHPGTARLDNTKAMS